MHGVCRPLDLGVIVVLLSILTSVPACQIAPQGQSPAGQSSQQEEGLTHTPIPAATIAVPAGISRSVERADVERHVGFTPLLPTSLPDNCDPEERTLTLRGPVVRVNYACGIMVLEQKAVAGLSVPSGSPGAVTQEVSVSGKRALYIEGTWSRVIGAAQLEKGAEFSWDDEGPRSLIFEREGISVNLMAYGRGVPDSREQLIQIAESMTGRPATP